MLDNSDKIILDLCGGTGAWSRPYSDAGYDVRNITLPEYDVRTYIPPDNFYGVLAAPPCTVFSKAAWKIPLEKRDFESGMEIVKSCLDIIWQVQCKGGKVRFWALENPLGHLRKFLGHPRFQFQGWQFGELNRRWSTKKYDIWGYFKTPRIPIKERSYLFTPVTRKSAPEWNRMDDIPKWLQDKKISKSDLRAITPPGFAKAFYESNK